MMIQALSKLRPMIRGAIQNMGSDDFFIELTDPHKVFSPGNVVLGNLVLILHKNQKINYISCKLKGEVMIRNQLVKGMSNKYTLFEDVVDLWGSPPDSIITDNASTISVTSSRNASPTTFDSTPADIELVNGGPYLQKGEHNFAFEFQLPKKGLFNSLEFERGSITYVITGFASVPGPKLDLSCKKSLSVVVPKDVSTLAPAKQTSLNIDVRKKRKQQGSIMVSLHIGHRGYLRGESVPVKISVHHIRPLKCVAGVVTTLSRISRMRGEGLEAQSFRKDLSQTISPLYTDPATLACTITSNLRIPPDTFPTITGHKVISFQYCVEVIVDLEGKCGLQARDPSAPASSSANKSTFIDIDKLKRHRGVVSLWTEIVIGTVRSSPSNGMLPSLPLESPTFHAQHSFTRASSSQSLTSPTVTSCDVNGTTSSTSSVGAPESASQATTASSTNYMITSISYDDQQIQSNGSSQGISEKQLFEMYENSLMPSAPPSHTGEPPFYASAPPQPGQAAAAYSTTETVAILPPRDTGDSSSYDPSDDKQELERRRLEEQTSQPYDAFPPIGSLTLHVPQLQGHSPSASSPRTFSYSTSSPRSCPSDEINMHIPKPTAPPIQVRRNDNDSDHST